jgi:hypothetical protein
MLEVRQADVPRAFHETALARGGMDKGGRSPLPEDERGYLHYRD